ncbi:MAG: enoyl-CoA hydratase-related protein [Gammaproteobacteria bacterium]
MTSPSELEDPVLFEKVKSIALIRLNRPDKLNAFTRKMGDLIVSMLDQAEADDSIQAIIITGNGRAFCAGADLSSGVNAFQSSKKDHDSKEPKDFGGILTLRMYSFLKPIIIACNGPAVGVGATMQLPADIRIASKNAKFGFVFLNRGIVNDACSSWFLPKIVGVSKALELCYSGEIISAEEALRINLISYIFEEENFIEQVLDFTQRLIVKSAPVSIAMSRQLIWTALGDNDPIKSHELESIIIRDRAQSRDALEGVNSFLERRSPKFSCKVSSDLPSCYPWKKD